MLMKLITNQILKSLQSILKNTADIRAFSENGAIIFTLTPCNRLARAFPPMCSIRVMVFQQMERDKKYF